MSSNLTPSASQAEFTGEFLVLWIVPTTQNPCFWKRLVRKTDISQLAFCAGRRRPMRAAILWLSGPLAFALIGGVIGGRLGINLGPGTDGRQFARRDRRNCRLHVSATLGDCGTRQRIKTMTVFAKQVMSVDDWAKVQDRIGDLQMALRAPHDLMMFSAEAFLAAIVLPIAQISPRSMLKISCARW